MTRRLRLFAKGELRQLVVPKQPTHRRHLHAVDNPSEQVRLNRDGAGLVPGRTDGLPVRLVKAHSAKKARMVSRDLGTVGKAMRHQWFPKHYLELFSGPGYLLDETANEEVLGSPIQALTIERPFDRYVFSDFSDTCADALDKRIEAMRANGHVLPPTSVCRGDANDPEHLDRVCSLIDPKALVIAYLDPAKPNLDFTTVKFLAERFRYIDFIINLPFNAMHRSISAGGYDGPSRMLDHPDPRALLSPEEGRTADKIREHYDEKLRSLGLECITRRCVTISNGSPLYDVVLASRNPAAVKLWERANPRPRNQQLGFGFDVA